MNVRRIAAALSLSLFAGALVPDTLGACWLTNPPLASVRELHTATRLADGNVLMVGGTTNHFAELYDVSTQISLVTGPMNGVHAGGHGAVLLANGQVLIAGGGLGPLDATNSAELFDPVTGQWSATGAMNCIRTEHTLTLLASGQVLAAGGALLLGSALYSAELYDPTSGAWTLTGSLSTHRYHHTATLLANGKVLVAGGVVGTPPPPYAELSSAELYDPATGTWTNTGSMNLARFFHTATLLADGRVLVAGGVSNDTTTNSVEEWDPLCVPVPVTAPLTGARRLADGSFQCSFTNAPGASLVVLASTNPAQSTSRWVTLSNVVETLAGRFQFTDPQVANYPQRFYRFRSQ